MAKKIRFTDAEINEFARWYKATYGKTFANRYEAEAALNREYGGGRQPSSGGSGTMFPANGGNGVMWSSGSLIPKAKKNSGGLYANHRAAMRSQLKESEKERRAQDRYRRRKADADETFRKKAMLDIAKDVDKMIADGMSEELPDNFNEMPNDERRKWRKDYITSKFSDRMDLIGRESPKGVDPMRAAPTSTRRPKAPSYGKKPRAGWGRIVVEEGDNKGEEFWTDPNGTLIKRTPIMTDENGNIQYEIQRKTEGGPWRKKGVMIGDDKSTFIPAGKAPSGAPQRPITPAPSIDPIPVPQGGLTPTSKKVVGKTPATRTPAKIDREPYTGYEEKGFAPVGKLAEDVYGSVARGLNTARDAWNSDWGGMAPVDNGPNYAPPDMSDEDLQALLDIEYSRRSGPYGGGLGGGLTPGANRDNLEEDNYYGRF